MNMKAKNKHCLHTKVKEEIYMNLNILCNGSFFLKFRRHCHFLTFTTLSGLCFMDSLLLNNY